jgi:hypothetical protein
MNRLAAAEEVPRANGEAPAMLDEPSPASITVSPGRPSPLGVDDCCDGFNFATCPRADRVPERHPVLRTEAFYTEKDLEWFGPVAATRLGRSDARPRLPGPATDAGGRKLRRTVLAVQCRRDPGRVPPAGSTRGPVARPARYRQPGTGRRISVRE